MIDWYYACDALNIGRILNSVRRNGGFYSQLGLRFPGITAAIVYIEKQRS